MSPRRHRSSLGRTALRGLASGIRVPGEDAAIISGRSPADGISGDTRELQSRLLQAGLAFVFLYASLSTLVDPLQFATYVPSWLSALGMGPMLRCFACAELLLAVALLTRRFVCPAALVAALALTGITLTNLDQFEVLFRNVAIIGAALALAISPPATSLLDRAQPRHVRRRRVD